MKHSDYLILLLVLATWILADVLFLMAYLSNLRD